LEFDSRKVRLLLFIAFSRLKPVVKAGLTGQFRMAWTNARRSNTKTRTQIGHAAFSTAVCSALEPKWGDMHINY
jgi:hypothetical protein